MSEAVLVTVVGHVATIALNRAQVHNAFDDALIADLTAALLGMAVAAWRVLANAGGSAASAASGSAHPSTSSRWVRVTRGMPVPRMASEGYAPSVALRRASAMAAACAPTPAPPAPPRRADPAPGS